MEWAMCFLQPLLLRDSSGNRMTSNLVNYLFFLGLCWSPLLFLVLDTSPWACITSGRRGPSSQASRNIITNNWERENIFNIFQNINSGHKQASEGHALPQRHHLHRGDQHGRHHRGEGELDTPPYYLSRLWLKTSTSGWRQLRKCQPATMATPLIFTSIKTI